MASQFRAYMKLKRREAAAGQGVTAIKQTLQAMRCPHCHMPLGTNLHIEKDVVGCVYCHAIMLELPAPGPDWMERYLSHTANPVELALVQEWFPDRSSSAAMTLIGWLGQRLKGQYTHGD